MAPERDDRQLRQSAMRMRLLEQLNGSLPTRDTTRGLTATVSNSAFDGFLVRSSASDQIARIATVIAAYPGLRVEVEGHVDAPGRETLSARRAEAVREILLSRGLSASAVTSRGLGNSRLLTSNATPAGREENQRVEIVISGESIGTMPFWDRSYPLKPTTGEER